jgi:hypothetical protein
MSPALRSTLLAAPLALNSPALGFEVSWTDQFGETIYTIAGPDSVALGNAVDVVIVCRDDPYPDDWVASSWSLAEDDVVVDSGSALFFSNSAWIRSYSFVYDSSANHVYTFRAKDLGHGDGKDEGGRSSAFRSPLWGWSRGMKRERDGACDRADSPTL